MKLHQKYYGKSGLQWVDDLKKVEEIKSYYKIVFKRVLCQVAAKAVQQEGKDDLTR